MAYPSVGRLVEFGDERLDRNRRVWFKGIGPACFDALHEVEKPLAGDIVADDEVEKLEVLYCRTKNEVHVRVSVSEVRIVELPSRCTHRSPF